MWSRNWSPTASSIFCSSPAATRASIENHFDHDPELFRALREANKQELLSESWISLRSKPIFSIPASECRRGLGDAVLCAENFAGEEPFLVALGDSILGLNARSRAVSRMAEVFEGKRASCVIAVEEVPPEETRHYGIVQPEGGVGRRVPGRQPGGKARPEGCARATWPSRAATFSRR